mgnify:CR=1 FL=1
MKKALSRIFAALIFCLGLLISFLLNPSLSYGHATTYKNLIIHHNGDLNPEIKKVIDLSLEKVKQAELYRPGFKSELCLNQGLYPRVVQAVLGDDVFTAFSNKVVVLGEAHPQFDRFRKWGRTLKYSQFLSHALLHNFQFEYHGLIDANPLGRHPNWKWEGYVEYEVLGQLETIEGFAQLIAQPATHDFDWIELTATEGTIKRHIRYLAMVKYCFEVWGWDYETLMASTVQEEELLELISTYKKRH